MCFDIDPNAKPWKRTKGYKAVDTVPGAPRTTFRSSNRACFKYHVGKVARANLKDGTSADGIWGKPQAKCGIYVCPSQAALKRRGEFAEVIIEVELDPKDFLHGSTDGDVATYKKVKVLRVVRKKRDRKAP